MGTRTLSAASLGGTALSSQRQRFPDIATLAGLTGIKLVQGAYEIAITGSSATVQRTTSARIATCNFARGETLLTGNFHYRKLSLQPGAQLTINGSLQVDDLDLWRAQLVIKSVKACPATRARPCARATCACANRNWPLIT